MNAITISNVSIRKNDNQFFNLNDLHKASGGCENHKPSNWLRLQQTQELIAEIETEGGKACEVINGGKNRGTFVCKELVYAYATWISAKFFLLVIRTFDAVVSGSPKTTTDERTPLRQAITALVSKRHIDYSDAYTLIHHRFGVAHIDELTHSQIPQAIEYVHCLTLSGEVLDKPVLPDELVLSIGRLLLHAQDMRLFVKRYLPAFKCLDIPNRGALWSYVHDTEPTFERVREYFLNQSPYQNHRLFSDDAQWVRRRVMATAEI